MAKKQVITNPFSVVSYLGKEYFCDRESESAKLIGALQNGRNITLISPRKIGKTGLIHHVFGSISPQEAYFFYVDIYATRCLEEFTKTLAEAVLSQQLRSFSARVWKEIARFFTSLRPTITADPITGIPQCTVDIQPQTEELTLQQLFLYLEKASLPCYVAIDEFQAIADYSDCNMEAMLRSHIQKLTNVHFIFAGSKKHIMMQMFASPNRPFFQSTQMMYITTIDEASYYPFALRHLSGHKQSISENTFHELYTLLSGHTWYMQFMLNRLYQDGTKEIDHLTIMRVLHTLLQENAPSYQTYCQLITPKQLAVLQAIAHEKTVKLYNSNEFLSKYNLGAASSVSSAIQALTDKELLFEENGEYSVYDRFFGIWLADRH